MLAVVAVLTVAGGVLSWWYEEPPEEWRDGVEYGDGDGLLLLLPGR